jgi:hypothetical protein
MPVIINGTTGIDSPAAVLTTTPLPVTSGGTGVTSLSGLAVGTTTNLAGGVAGAVPYQSGAGATGFSAAGTSGQPIVSGGAGAPVFRPYTLPASDGSASQLLQTNGAGALSFATVSAGFTLATPVASTSGTSITFTGIPAGVKQIIIMLNEVSTGGSDPLCIRIGDSGGIETSGYDGFACSMGGSNTTQIGSTVNSYQIESALPAVSGYTRSGNIVINLENSSNNTWVSSGTIKGSGPYVSVSAGRKSLSAVLDRVSVSSTSTSNSFGAGEINIMYI